MKKYFIYVSSFIIITLGVYACQKSDYINTSGRPTIAQIRDGNTTPNIDYAFTYTASGLDLNFSTTKSSYYYSWDFGDGTTADYLPGNSTSHTYSVSGTYTVTLSLFDVSYNPANTYTRSINVSSSLSPALSCISSASGSSITISASSVSTVQNTSDIAIYASTNYGDITILLPTTVYQGSTYTCSDYSSTYTSFQLYTNSNWTNIPYTYLYGYHPSASAINTVSLYITSVTSQGITGTFSGDVATSGTTYSYTTLSSGSFSAPY